MGGHVMYDFKQMYLPHSIEEALELLEENKGAEIISGGTDVLIKIREGKLEDATLINIHEIKELKGIHMEEDGTIVIGAGTVFSHITNNEIIQFCSNHGYEIIWFHRDIEEALIKRHFTTSKQKTVAATNFAKNKAISKLDLSKLNDVDITSKTFGTSNVKSVFDKYLK